MMDVEGQKALYENLDEIARDAAYGHDMLGEVLLALTGLTRVYSDGRVGLDVRTRDQANRVAVRWLRDHGYLSRAVDAHT